MAEVHGVPAALVPVPVQPCDADDPGRRGARVVEGGCSWEQIQHEAATISLYTRNSGFITVPKIKSLIVQGFCLLFFIVDLYKLKSDGTNS